jgi:pilus assembly protein CpaF
MAPPAAATPVGASPMMAPPPAAPAPPTEQRPAVPMPAPAPQASRPRLVGAGARKVASRSVAPPSRRGVVLEPLDPKVIKALDLQAQILERLRAKVDLDNIPIERLGDEDVWQKSERAIVDLVNGLEQSGELPKYVDRDGLIKDTLNEALGLGPLEDLLADDKLDEIRVDRRDRVIVGKDEAMRGSGRAFSSDDVLRRVVERLVAPLGLTVDDDHPVVDVRLRDGSRLTAAVAPASVHGPCLVLRKPVRIKRTLADLVGAGGLSPAMSSFLSTCVAARRNLAVCGPAGAGKAGIVAALVGAVPDGERVVTVEDVAELSLDREDWIALETRPTVGLGALVASALRLRPDRLVVGDLRGGRGLRRRQRLRRRGRRRDRRPDRRRRSGRAGALGQPGPARRADRDRAGGARADRRRLRRRRARRARRRRRDPDRRDRRGARGPRGRVRHGDPVRPPRRRGLRGDRRDPAVLDRPRGPRRGRRPDDLPGAPARGSG